MTDRVAVILLNWNSFIHTSNCIDSLYQCKGESFTIVVIDNGSVDESANLLENKFPLVKVIRLATNLGFAGGNNVGLKWALDNDFEYVMMLNNDVFVDPSFMFYLITYMDFNSHIAAVQPKIYFNHNKNILWNNGSKYFRFFGWTYSRGYMFRERVSSDKIIDVDWITGCAFFIRAKVLKETSLLNDNYFIYYEDVDLSFRLKKIGYKLSMHPKSVIYHIAGVSQRKLKKGREGFSNPIVHYLNFRNHAWLLRRWTYWYEWPTVLFFYFIYSLLVLLYFALRCRFQKFRSVLKGIYHGFTLSYK